MAPRTLKETYSRKKSSEFVETVVKTHGGEVGTSLATRLSEHLEEGEEMPDIELFFTLIGRRMGAFRTTMVDAARAHANELANDDAIRKLREETAAALSRDYVAVRAIFSQAFGPESALAIGFEDNVAREPAALELQVDRLIANLGNPELVLPEPRVGGVALSPPANVETFRPNLDKLKEAREALDREHQKADRTVLTKNQAVENYDREFVMLSRCLEAAFALAGESGLARRVRPSARRPGRRLEVENDPEPDETGPSPGEPAPAEEPPPDPADGSGVS